MTLLRFLPPLLSLVCSALGTQWPLAKDSRQPTAYDGFKPIGALRSVAQTEGFTTFGHPLFPQYSARIKRLEHWCDEQVGLVSSHVE